MMAKAYRVRPSVLLGVGNAVRASNFDIPGDDAYLAYCIDRAVWSFGTSVEYDMDEAEQECGPEAKSHTIRNARQKVYDKYMQFDDQETTSPKGRFADPVPTVFRSSG